MIPDRAAARSRRIAAAALLTLCAGCASASAPAAAPVATAATATPVGRAVIAPPGASRLAPYSPAIRTGDLVFLSGQVGLRPGTTELVSGGTAAETRQALANIRTILEAAGLTPAAVVKCTVFLVDMADYAAVNAIYGEFFSSEPPARTALAVAALPIGARVEIDCIATARP